MSVAKRVSRSVTLVCTVLMALALVAAPGRGAQAQAASAPPVLILPIDQAQFIIGQKMDVRIEVWADAVPADFAVKVNGQDAATVFNSKPVSESWKFDATKGNALSYTYRSGLTGTITAQGTTWRNVSINTPGDFKVEVTAGGKTTSVTYTVRAAQSAKAKNAIFFLGDGMATGMRTAARLVSRGLSKGGKYNSPLFMDTLGAFGEVSTNGYDSILTDSANSMSAYMTGQKGVVNSMGVYADTSDSNDDDPKVQTMFELAKAQGKSVGVCVTSRVTDATPAATWAHTRRRADEDKIIDQALKLGVDVILGGGAIFFQPKSVPGSDRKDDRDLFKEFEAAGYTVVNAGKDLVAIDASKTNKLLGIFSASHMNVWLDRNLFPDNVKSNGPDQPGLMEMCQKAIDILSKNSNGFVLMVEGSDIDKQEHSMSWERAVADAIEMDNVVGYTKEWAAKNGNNTLISVIGDHAHAFDVYGTIDLAQFDALAAKMNAAATAPATQSATAAATSAATAPAVAPRVFPTLDPRLAAIGVYQNAGIPDYKPGKNNFPESWTVKYPLVVSWGDHPPYTEDFRLDPKPLDGAVVPSGSVAVPNPARDPNGVFFTGNLPGDNNQAVHTLQDVPVTAMGPGSECFNGWKENTEVFFCVANALGMNPVSAPATPAASVVLPLALLGALGGSTVLRRKLIVR